MKVVVIGGGASGVFCLGRLLEAGIKDVLLFEQGDSVGGVWCTRQQNNFGGRAYKNLSTNSSKIASSVGSKIVPSQNEFPTAGEMRSYYKSFTEESHVRLNERVESVEKDDKGCFTVKTSKQMIPDVKHVIVCTGVYARPNKDVKTVESFEGPIMHSYDYFDKSQLTKMFPIIRTTLIIGIGNSALDIALDLLASGSKVVISSEGALLLPIWNTERDEPVDFFVLSREFQSKSAQERSIFLENVGKDLTSKIVQKGMPFPTSGRISVVKDPELLTSKADSNMLIFKPKLIRCEGHVAYFSDNSSLEVDIILLCTGYRVGFEFLSKELNPLISFHSRSGSQSREDYCRLYKYVVHPEHPNMFFCGFFDSFGNNGVISDMQARWIAAVITKNLTLPGIQEMVEWASEQMRKDGSQRGHSFMYRSFVRLMQMYATDLGMSTCAWPSCAPVTSFMYQSRL